MVIVMRLEESLYLFGEEREEFVGRLCFHEGPRDCDFGLLQGKRLVSVQSDGTYAEVGASQVNSQIDALGLLVESQPGASTAYLFRAIGYGGDIGWNLAQWSSLFL